MTKTKRTYTVVFMVHIGPTFAGASIPKYFRQYKNYISAMEAINTYWQDYGGEAFIVPGDKRLSHKKRMVLIP